MVLKLSDFNKEQREEFPHPQVGFITSTANLSVITSSLTEVGKYYSGCLGGDGNIYFGAAGIDTIYQNDFGNILKFNPKTLETTKFIITGDPYNQNPGFSALICGKDGNIYGIARDGPIIYKLDVFNESITPIDIVTSTSNSNYQSACLAPNGKIYGIPGSATSVLEIDPVNQTSSTFGSVSSGSLKWYGAVLGPDGFIYGIPNTSTTILKINPENNTVSTFGNVTGGWAGGCLAPNGKIYCPPHVGELTTSILKIDPIAGTATTFGSIDLSYFTEFIWAFQTVATVGWIGASLASNGKIYCSPLGGKGILEINPENDTVNVIGIGSLPQLSNGTIAALRWYPFIQSPDGKMYAPPTTETKILVFGETSNVEPADWLLSPYQNKAL